MVLINNHYCRNLEDALDVISDRELAEGLAQLIKKDRERVRAEKANSIAWAESVRSDNYLNGGCLYG